MSGVTGADDPGMVRLGGGLLVVALVVTGCGDASPTETQQTHKITTPTNAAQGAGLATTATARAPGAPPVLLGAPGAAPPGRDDPPALRLRLEARRLEAMKLLREAAAAPRSAAGGCVLARPTMGPGATPPKAWLPKPPERVEAQMLGRQVQVDVTIPSAAASPACRVAGVTIVVFSGTGGTSTFNNIGGIENYELLAGREQLLGRTVRLVGRIPYGGSPPYHLSVNTQTVQGLRSTYDDRTLACADGGRCLPGGRPPARPGLPKPLLPMRGITPATLEASVRQVLAGEPPLWGKATRATCATTRACRVEFYDSVVRARLRLRYAVEGEQRPGCWLAMVTRSETVPAQAAVTSPAAARRLGGCVSWAG